MALLKGRMIYMGSDKRTSIRIEIFDSRVSPSKQLRIELPNNTDVAPSILDALQFATLVKSSEDPLFQKKNSVGVFGVALGPKDPIYDGDRIELYRPILIDPKKIRRKKANQNKDAELKTKAKLRKERKDLREI